MDPPRVYMCSPSWTPLPPLSPYHPSGSSQCTSPEHPVSCIEPGLEIHFTYDNIHVSMPFSQTIPPLSSPTESKKLFYTSVSLLLSCIQDYHYHLSKFHIYGILYWCFSFWLTSLLFWYCMSCSYIWYFWEIYLNYVIVALFIIARTWKQPRCPSADEWIRKLWYIYTMEYLLLSY